MGAIILYVDDALNHVMVRKMLKPYGYRVLEEGDAQGVKLVIQTVEKHVTV